MRAAVRPLHLLAVVAGCLTLSACGGGGIEPIPETGATLEGTVTYGGEKLHAATILVASQGGGAQGAIGDDGRYVVKNAPLGDVTIGINTAAAKGAMMGRMMAEKGKTPVKVIDVPGKYTDPMKSGIKTTVVRGQNTFDIVIPK